MCKSSELSTNNLDLSPWTAVAFVRWPSRANLLQQPKTFPLGETCWASETGEKWSKEATRKMHIFPHLALVFYNSLKKQQTLEALRISVVLIEYAAFFCLQHISVVVFVLIGMVSEAARRFFLMEMFWAVVTLSATERQRSGCYCCLYWEWMIAFLLL